MCLCQPLAQRTDGGTAHLAGSAEWNSMVEDIVVSCAGLVQYLADQWPPELQEGWLQY